VNCIRLLLTGLIASIAAPAFAQDFEIYVSDAGNFNNPPWQILKFDADGANPQVFTNQNLGWPQDILFLEEQGLALISNLNSNRINRHDADTGAFIDAFAVDISGPTRMKIGPDNLIYALQWTGDGTVKRYQLDGTALGNFTRQGISQSIGLDWDADGNLYVSSFNLASVRRFDPQGNDLGIFIGSNLSGPTNIWFDDSGDMLVNDWSGNRIQRFDANGTFKSTFASGISQPEGMGLLPSGNLLVGNGSRSVTEYDPGGNALGERIPVGSGNLIQANAVVVRSISGEPEFSINQGLTGAWFDPGTAGQGFLIDVEPQARFMFVAWFTYQQDSSKIGTAEHRWLTAQGNYDGGTATLDLFSTSGGQFDRPQATNTANVGGLTVTFSDCRSGSLDYSLPDLGLEGSISIIRLIPATEALCESEIRSQ
jgi:hypothetical protein